MDFTLEDLDIDISDLSIPPARGRRAIELNVSFAREVTLDDVAALVANPERGSLTPSLQKLKSSHHQLARLIAEGRTDADCHLITGYSVSRISLLKRDPAFADLVSYYSEQVTEVYVNVHQRLANVGLDALEELQERLEEAPEKFSHTELLAVMERTLDRGGYGPKSTQVHEVGTSVSSLLEAVKEEVRNRQNGRIKTLDATARPSEGRGAGGSDDPSGPALVLAEGEAPLRLPREGEEL